MSPADSSFLALPTKLPSTNMGEEIQLVKISVATVLESMPADVMIHIASGCKPGRADCGYVKLAFAFLMHVHSKYCQNSPSGFYF